MTTADAFAACLDEIRLRGLLPASDASLPCAAAIVAGGPVAARWWKGERAETMRATLGRLVAEPSVLIVKLVSERATFVHRSLWPHVFLVATSGDAWQTDGLPGTERALLDAVEARGAVCADDAAGKEFDAHVPNLGREIERRLLVVGSPPEWGGGPASRTLTSWRTRTLDGWPEPLPREYLSAAYRRLDDAARALGPAARLPWWPVRSLRRMSG